MENIKPTEIKKELSPETVLKTMGKVFDIDTKGTAYSCIVGFSNLGFCDFSAEDEEGKEESAKFWKELMEKTQKILDDGLVGLSKDDTGEVEYEKKPIKEKYIEHLKEHGITNQFVYANIIGRAETDDKTHSLTEAGNSWWMNISDFNIAVIFDKDFFEEDEPKKNDLQRTFLNDKWKFNADDPKVVGFYEHVKKIFPDIKIGDARLVKLGRNSKRNVQGKGFDENGMPHPYEEFGFAFFPRVPKRTFKGLVVKIPKDELYDQRVQEVADIVQESNLQIPIYDTDGNVLWPQKMSFEEVKKLAVKTKQESE